MSENSQVTRLLAKRFSQPDEHGRIVFWLDDKKQYADVVATLVGEHAADEALREVELITPEIGDENDRRYIPFTVRYRMFHEKPNQKFLVYLTEPAPALQDDWLLDLKLAYGPTFTMDKLAVTLTEMLPETSYDTRKEWMEVMKCAPEFFDSEERVKRFAKRLTAHDDIKDFQAKMIATLLHLKDDRHSMQDIWAELLTQYSQGDDSGITAIERMGLSAFHWAGTRRIYHFDVDTDSGNEPTVKDFVLWLFQLAWNGFSDGKNALSSYANIIRDWDDWYKNIDMRAVLQNLSENVVDELQLSAQIADMSVEELADRDLFRDVDEMIVNKLYERLGEQSITDDQVQRIINGRKQKLWYADYADQYECIAAASELRAVLTECSGLIGAISSPEQGMELYADKLYKADGTYRRYVLAWHQANPDAVSVNDDLQNAYETYQQDLGQAWQKQVDTLSQWKFVGTNAQTDFYDREVAPTLKANRKIAVIISDALRYEAAQELSERIDRESRFSTKLDMQYSVLPSYTQLGMAALLPHDSLEFDSKNPTPKDRLYVLSDGRSTRGVGARDAILSDVGGKAIRYDDLIKLKVSEIKELYKSCNVLYVYHNHIDATGDAEKTETETVDACEKTFKELGELVKKLASGNVYNMIITADHGFLYQDRDLSSTEWLSEQPKGDAVWVKKRRFSIGSNLAPGRAFVTFTAAQIGMDDSQDEGVSIQVPNSIMRLRMQGTGVRYVHGGAALQEIVVPVLHVSKGRSAADDVRPVEFTILQRTDRLSSRQLTVEFLQNEPVGGKIRARTVLAGLWGRDAAGNDVLISNETPVAFDLLGQEKSERHVKATLMLTSDAERFNGTNIELRLREKTDGSNVLVMLDQKARYFFKQGVVADDAGFFD